MDKEVLLQEIKEEAISLHVPILQDESLKLINLILTIANPKNILEIGTAVGYSAICFTDFLAPDGLIDTIEREPEKVAEAKENVKKLKLEDKIKIYEGVKIDKDLYS